jgi:tetratricopeptide (TPR) repeat protein
MNANKLKKGHILNYYKALNISATNPKLAIKLLLDALKKSPYLTGAYFLLGKLYLNQNDMTSSWICFELAQRISPNHVVFDGFIPALKERILMSRPHFFLTVK